MPFPAPQGTQAAVAAMVRADSRTRKTTLISYGASAQRHVGRVDQSEIDLGSATWQRNATSVQLETTRSGPSMRKVWSDVQMTQHLRHARPKRPLIAHHVEAASACLAAGRPPDVFFAHTSLGPELPTYAPPLLRAPLALAGDRLDHLLCRKSSRVAAISPLLASQLEQLSGREVHYVPTPWSLPEPGPSRSEAQHRLRIPRHACMLLYAGNLDAYQGWEMLIEVVARLPEVLLLVATESDPAPLRNEALQSGVAARVLCRSLETESDRALVHAACDLALVPRRSPGGLPMKLLDSLARGIPTLANRKATAGLDFGQALALCEDSAASMAAQVRSLLKAPEARQRMSKAGTEHIRLDHSEESYVRAMDALLSENL